MKRVGTLIALTLTIFGAAASVSLATLPSLKLLSGESFPVNFETNVTTPVTLESGAARQIVCLKYLLLSIWPGVTGAYKNNIVIASCTEGTNKCKSAMEPAGTIAVETEGHLVFTSLSPLTVGVLATVPTTTIACGTTESPEKVKVKVEGSVLGSFTAVLNTDITESTSEFKGSKGKQTKTKYFNEAGEEVSAKLSANFGLGSESVDFNLGSFVDKYSKMIIVSG
ncbi:MAG TPA: hypothetical protein VHW67_14120 [Solirubrobacteraceae bacterium]|nr:hypothetical protein [Solirubrobacteraceae bacterium]